MHGNVNGGNGLIEDNVDLEVDNINFWANLGVTPHVNPVDPVHPIQSHHHNHSHYHNQHHHQESIEPQLELVEQLVRRELFEVDCDPRLEPFIGMEFDSGEAAKTFYIAYAGRIGFSVRIARSRRSKCSESVIMLRFVCSREGFSREKRIIAGKKTRKRAASIREGCKAMLEVIRRADGKWSVTKLIKEHNHEVGMPSRVHYIATEVEGDMEPYLGMEFESLEIAKTFYYVYASRVGFEARVRQSRRSPHDECLKMLKLVCSMHKYHSGRDNNGEDSRRLIQDTGKEGCDALFEIIRKDNGIWVVSKLVLEHSHELIPSPPSKVKCVRSQGEMLVIAKNFSDTRNLLLSGQDSQNYLREVRYNDLGPEDAQDFLDYLKKAQAENPTFYYGVQVENNNVMTNIFWADAKARMDYSYFGDAVTFDMTFKNDKEMMPIVTFRGVNHHAQPIVFGCALLVDESETSFIWLFKQLLAAMDSREPVSLITDLNRAVSNAVAKVFPNTRHCFCRRHILNTIQDEFADLFSPHNLFQEELMKCIDESETCESFESCWDAVLDKYDLRDHTLLQSLYNIRHQWVPVYMKDTFFAELDVSRKSVDLEAIIANCCHSKNSLALGIKQLGLALASTYENEAQADFLTMFEKPYIRTASPLEKQAAGIYTRALFDRYQEEFLEALGYHVNKYDDGVATRFQLTRDDGKDMYTVTFSASEVKVHCSCCLFEVAGILCRHVLRVFIVSGVRTLPKEYILKRWTKHAKSYSVGDECGVEIRGSNGEPTSSRYNDLCKDAIRCAREGSTSGELYNLAKDELQKVFAQIVTVKQKREQQSLESYMKPQSKHAKRHGKVMVKKDFSSNNVKRSGSKLSAEDEYR